VKAKLGRLVLGEITNISDAERAVASTLLTIGGLKDDCAKQKAALEVHKADLKSALLAKGEALWRDDSAIYLMAWKDGEGTHSWLVDSEHIAAAVKAQMPLLPHPK